LSVHVIVTMSDQYIIVHVYASNNDRNKLHIKYFPKME